MATQRVRKKSGDAPPVNARHNSRVSTAWCRRERPWKRGWTPWQSKQQRFLSYPGSAAYSASTSSTSRRRLQNGSNGTEVELNAGVAGASASAGAGAAEVEERQLELLTSASLRIGAAKQDLEAADITARTQTQRRSEAVKSAFHIVNVGANELTSTLDTHALRRRRDLPQLWRTFSR